MPCGFQHIYVIRGWNLVYEVETEAAKLKSFGTGLGPGLNGGLARLRQVSQVRGGCVGGKRTAYHQVSECEALPVRERAGRPRAVRAKFQGGGHHAA